MFSLEDIENMKDDAFLPQLRMSRGDLGASLESISFTRDEKNLPEIRN